MPQHYMPSAFEMPLMLIAIPSLIEGRAIPQLIYMEMTLPGMATNFASVLIFLGNKTCTARDTNALFQATLSPRILSKENSARHSSKDFNDSILSKKIQEEFQLYILKWKYTHTNMFFFLCFFFFVRDFIFKKTLFEKLQYLKFNISIKLQYFKYIHINMLFICIYIFSS